MPIFTISLRIDSAVRGRTVREWKLRPSQPDNHWLDCLVGAAVAASVQGASMPTLEPVPRPRRWKRKYGVLSSGI